MNKNEALSKIFEHLSLLEEYKVLREDTAKALYSHIEQIVQEITSLEDTIYESVLFANRKNGIDGIDNVIDFWNQFKKLRPEDLDDDNDGKGNTPK